MDTTELEADIEQARQLHGDVAELEAVMRVLPRFDPRTSTAQRRYCVLLLNIARLRQSAIRRAITIYKIDARRVRAGVGYSSYGDMREREGATFVDQDGGVRVEIGDEAFASAGRLGSTIAHEVEVHVNRHLARGIYYPPTDEQGWLIQEVEAYDYELASRDRFGLSVEELGIVEQRRASVYRRLHPHYRKRADRALHLTW